MTQRQLIVFFFAWSVAAAAGAVASDHVETADRPVAGAVSLPDPVPTAPSVADDYRIGPGDLLVIDVFRVDEFDRRVRVNVRGNISLPLVGEIQAAGKTSVELEKSIASILARDYLQDPQVSVFIEEYTSLRVTVEGQVKRPGVYPISGRTTLLQALALAEGTTDLGDIRHVQLLRRADDGSRRSLVFDLERIRAGEAVDPLVRGDDLVIVRKLKAKSAIRDVTNALRGLILFGL